MSRDAPALPLVAFCFALLVGCGTRAATQYDALFAEASRHDHAGRYAAAAVEFENASRLAKSPKERDRALYLSGMSYYRGGRSDLALGVLHKLATAVPQGYNSAQAAYRAAMIRIGRGETARGYAELASVYERFPDSGIAHAALRLCIAERAKKDGAAAAIRWLTEQERNLGEKLRAMAAYERGRLEESVGDDGAALATFLRVARDWPYPSGALYDDALFRASLAAERRGDIETAVRTLEELARVRETTSLMGSYQRPKMTKSLLRLAYLYGEKQGDRDKARRALRRLADEYTTSTERDDALWMEAELWQTDGKQDRACDALRTLVNRHPNSRYVPCAVDRCQGLERPSQSRAPKTCRDYSKRRAKLTRGDE